MKNHHVLTESPDWLVRRGTVLLLLACLGVLYLCFSLNQNCLLFGIDGAAWRVMLNAQAVFRSVFTQTGADPFQGSFDAWYPSRPEYLLPSALGLLITGAVPGKVATYFVYGAFLLFGTYALARSVGFERSVALLGSFLLPLLALPAWAHRNALLYGLFTVNPHISQIVSLSVLMVATFWILGRSTLVWTAFLVFVPALCLMLAILALMPDVVLMVPAVAVYGGASLLDARSWRDDVSRVVAGILVIAIPAALGTLHYLYGIVEYTAYNFFSAEFEHARGNMVFASSLFGYWPLGRLAVPLGIVGAAWTALTETGRLRLFALTHLVATALFLVVAVVIVQAAHAYQGPSPVYFETCLWPYALLFAAAAIVNAARVLLGWRQLWSVAKESLTLPGSWKVGRVAKLGAVPRLDAGVLVGILVVTAGFNLVQASRKDNFCPTAAFNPIEPTVITEPIEHTVAIAPGKPFNGFAATIYALRGKPSISWFDLHPFDVAVWRATGNDLRIVGLWKYGIPTLFQYFTFITPPYYLLLTDFLARPEDRQYRSVLVLTRIDKTMLQLWGVRFVITDIDSDAGVVHAEQPINDGETIRLIELSDVNVGDYSPTEVRHVDDFHDGLAVMHAPGFDGRRVLVTDAAPEGPYVKAEDVRLVYDRDGLNVHARSAGRSVLVLPAQYSHCWTVSGDGQPTLFRANLMQLAVAFTGTLEAKLVFRYGPIFAGECRIEDLHDMKRLRIQEARQAADRGAAIK